MKSKKPDKKVVYAYVSQGNRKFLEKVTQENKLTNSAYIDLLLDLQRRATKSTKKKAA